MTKVGETTAAAEPEAVVVDEVVNDDDNADGLKEDEDEQYFDNVGVSASLSFPETTPTTKTLSELVSNGTFNDDVVHQAINAAATAANTDNDRSESIPTLEDTTAAIAAAASGTGEGSQLSASLNNSQSSTSGHTDDEADESVCDFSQSISTNAATSAVITVALTHAQQLEQQQLHESTKLKSIQEEQQQQHHLLQGQLQSVTSVLSGESAHTIPSAVLAPAIVGIISNTEPAAAAFVGTESKEKGQPDKTAETTTTTTNREAVSNIVVAGVAAAADTGDSAGAAEGDRFVNQGLELWEKSRKEWLGDAAGGGVRGASSSCGGSQSSSTSGAATPPTAAATPLDVDDIIDVIFISTRQQRDPSNPLHAGPKCFPKPVPLPQMIDILVDLWEAEGLDI